MDLFYVWYCEALMMLILCDVLFCSWTLMNEWFDQTECRWLLYCTPMSHKQNKMDVGYRDRATSVPTMPPENTNTYSLQCLAVYTSWKNSTKAKQKPEWLYLFQAAISLWHYVVKNPFWLVYEFGIFEAHAPAPVFARWDSISTRWVRGNGSSRGSDWRQHARFLLFSSVYLRERNFT